MKYSIDQSFSQDNLHNICLLDKLKYKKKNNISEPSLTFCRNKILQLLAWKTSLGDWTREFLYDDDITTFCLHWKLNGENQEKDGEVKPPG